MSDFLPDPNVVYQITYLCPLKVKDAFYDDVEENFPPYNKTISGEVHVFHEVIIVINVDDHVIDTLDQPCELTIIPLCCLQQIHPLYCRKDKTK